MSNGPIMIVCKTGNSTVTPREHRSKRRALISWKAANSTVTLIFPSGLFPPFTILRGQTITRRVSEDAPLSEHFYYALCHVSTKKLGKDTTGPIIIIE